VTQPVKGGQTSTIVDNATRVGLDVVGLSGGFMWDDVDVVIGQTTPTLQGWYSPQYGTAVPSPVLQYTFPTVPAPGATFAWLLVPTIGSTPSGASGKITSSTSSGVDVEVVVGGISSVFTIEL